MQPAYVDITLPPGVLSGVNDADLLFA